MMLELRVELEVDSNSCSGKYLFLNIVSDQDLFKGHSALDKII